MSEGRPPGRRLAKHTRPLHLLAEIFLQYQGHGAAQTGHTVFVRGDYAGSAAARQYLGLDFGFNHGPETMPGPGEVADYHDALGRKSGHDHAHAAPQVVRHGFQSPSGPNVTLVGETEQIGETQVAGRRTGFEVVTQSRAIRGEYFPAATAAATAYGAF